MLAADQEALASVSGIDTRTGRQIAWAKEYSAPRLCNISGAPSTDEEADLFIGTPAGRQFPDSEEHDYPLPDFTRVSDVIYWPPTQRIYRRFE